MLAGMTDEKEISIVHQFDRFASYFYGFFQNRENMFSEEAKSTGVANRCISDNLPRFLDNAKNASRIFDALSDQMEEIDATYKRLFGVSVKEMFSADYFSFVLSQEPRIKRDIVNSVLDMAYSLLFTFVDSILESFGFDTFCGVMHTQFYMQKSLVCDLIEPFRPLMDQQVKKSINLKQIGENDFLLINHQYRLKWEKNADYVGFLMKPLIEQKDNIFAYIQAYYRSFMKGDIEERYSEFAMEWKEFKVIIVSYDISDNKKRNKFNKYIRKFGHKLQFSVYEIENSNRVLNNVIADITNKFSKTFDETDSIYIMKLSASCEILKYGYASHEDDPLLIVK